MAATTPPVFIEIPTPELPGGTAAVRVQQGLPFTPQQQILLYSAEQWELFTQEWVHSQKTVYTKVQRYAGAGDMGIDIAGFTDSEELFGVWDNFQCKHYDNALTPTTAVLEIGKIIYYSFSKKYDAPRKMYFIAPKDCGMKLKRLLGKPEELKRYVLENWEKYCSEDITGMGKIELKNELKKYAEAFEYSIFQSKGALEIIDEHRKTPWFSTRFGGGLPDRPAVDTPPFKIAENESRYIAQLFEAYSDYSGVSLTRIEEIVIKPELTEHYKRQREYFFNAEALRNFARDTVPPGTFEDLKNEVYDGVIDVESAVHTNAFVRLNAVTTTASGLQMVANALMTVVKIKDRKGICHQLANEDRLIWKKK